MATVATETLLTAEEFRRLPDNGKRKELIRGRVVYMNVPAPRHGYICANIVGVIRPFVVANRLGRVMSNDSGVRTEDGPDTVRGADVAFWSFRRLPPGPLPEGYLQPVPELVFEVRSPTDRWGEVRGTLGQSDRLLGRLYSMLRSEEGSLGILCGVLRRRDWLLAAGQGGRSGQVGLRLFRILHLTRRSRGRLARWVPLEGGTQGATQWLRPISSPAARQNSSPGLARSKR